MPRSKKAFDSMRESTRQKIEATALSLFARKGLSVTIGEIARSGGISQGLLYSHFASKDELIIELTRQATEISGNGIMEIANDNMAAELKIKQITSMMCQMLSQHNMGIDYFMFMIQVGMSGFQIPKEAYYAVDSPSPVESLANIIAQGQCECTVVKGNPLQLSTIYWAAIQGLCCYVIAGIPLSPDPEALNRILLRENLVL